MNYITEQQEGSPSRDRFKLLHKRLNRNFWALDSDLELIEKHPVPFIVARIDFKQASDNVTFSEAISYNQNVNLPMPYYVPVYIVESGRGFVDQEAHEHRFNIYRYIQADYKPFPPKVEQELIREAITWREFEQWEAQLRRERKQQMAEYYHNRPLPWEMPIKGQHNGRGND